MKKALILALFAALAGSGCDPFQPSQDQATHDINSIVFSKHANGLCFAVLRFNGYAGYQGVSITNVPASACEPKAEAR